MWHTAMALSPRVGMLLYMSALFLSLATTPAEAKLELINNGFEGVVVGISPSITEAEANNINLLQGIKQMLEEGSQALFEATHKRAFLRKVDILIPISWNSTSIDAMVGTHYKDSQIRVNNINPIYLEQPYTEQLNTTCGAPGDFIHLTPQYITDDVQVGRWGPRGKNMATEWAKFRWGIFDELGYPNDNRFPLFYHDGNASQPTICNDKPVDGIYYDRATRTLTCKHEADGLPDANCRFYPDQNNSEVQSSLLSFGTIGNDISLFCDDGDHQHNGAAPTKQNFYCDRKSAMHVIMDHQDFTSNRNPAITKAEQVQFQIVKQDRDVNYVLVLDYSGSMSNEDRMLKLQKTSQDFIRTRITEGNFLAVVRFESSATTLAPLTKISNSNRDSLANKIEINNNGSTCIGCGINKALEILHGKINCVILLLTDGEENEDPRIKDVNDNVVASGCRVVSVAFGADSAIELEDLVENTDGKSFYANDNEESITQLDYAFTSLKKYEPEPDPSDINIMISDTRPYRGPIKDYGELFVVDKGFGRNLEFRLMTNDFSHITKPPVLTGPDGQDYDVTSEDANKGEYIIQVKTVKSGNWQFNVGLSGNINNFIRSSVTCQPEADVELPISIDTWTSAPAGGIDLINNKLVVFAKVQQGNNPVVGADVIAFITLPDETTDPKELVLLDDGSDPDALHGDGIYSRYLTGIPKTGRIIIKTEVNNGLETVIYKGAPQSRRKKRDLTDLDFIEKPERCCGTVIPKDRIVEEPTGNFTRSAVAGSVKVTNIPVEWKDTVPPSKVSDLTVKNSQWDDTNVYHITLTWTAPGDDQDTGKVTKYSLRFSQDQTDLSDGNFKKAKEYDISSEMNEDILKEAGTEESLNISIDLQTYLETFLEDVPYYFALKSEDDNGNISPVSDAIRVNLTSPSCGQIEPPQNGYVIGDGHRSDDIVKFACDSGYELDGKDEALCLRTGKWFSEVPQCHRKDCGQLQNPQFGSVIGDGHLYGDNITFDCASGYELNGDAEASCLDTGNWSVEVPLCQRKDCGKVHLKYGTVIGDGHFYGDSIKFSCASGYKPSGADEAFCLPTGTWSIEVPQCERKDCGQLQPPQNGYVEGTGHLFGDIAKFSCDIGYGLDSDDDALCLHTGNWSAQVPQCQPSCFMDGCPGMLKCNDKDLCSLPKWLTSGIGQLSNDVIVCKPPFVRKDRIGCVYMSNKTLNWKQAKKNCENMGAQLIVNPPLRPLLHHITENGHSKSNYWVGGKYFDKWQWLDGETISQGWSEGQPEFHIRTACLYFNWAGNGLLSEHWCGQKKKFICEKPLWTIFKKN